MDRPVCIIHFVNGEISGWFIASDTYDAKRKATAIGAHELARTLHTIEWLNPGKYELLPGFVALVD